MNIILISECTKSSAKHSRRILSKYARHIARRTWIASITQEGLDYLQQELTQIANKNTAVVCHKIISRSEIKRAWIVGSHKQFDDEGNFAFRYTENLDDQYRIELSALSRDTIKFFSSLNKLAGLFHDAGKNFYYFQNKLIHHKTGKAAGDPIRHEYLSFLCFFYLYEFKEERYQDQLTGLKRNIDTLTIDNFQQKIKSLSTASYYKKLFTHNKQKFTLAKLLSHLILSHHRLIKANLNDQNQQIIFDDSFYFNDIHNTLKTDDINKIFQKYQQQKLVLFDPKWQKQVDYSINTIIDLLNKKQTGLDALLQDENVIMSVTHYILRPALIMADQSVSARPSKMDEKIRTDPSYSRLTAIANTKDHKNNQSLLEHLTWVGQQSYKNNNILWQSILSRKRLYSIAPSIKLERKVAKHLTQFHWQDAMVKATHVIDKKQSYGFFAVVMAKTGAGKTRANAKIMAALDKDMRFSTLLGLRTLTLQTLDEYRDNLGIQTQNILGIIGDNTTRVLHEADKNPNKESALLNDLFSDEQHLNISKNLFKDVDTPFPTELCFSNDRDTKLDAISKIPILVATIDYMISGLDATRSSKTRFLTRLMTSDLIIDEIDSYNPNDLMAIHKLAYLTGFYGKKLVISSATLPERLIESFYHAYATGYQRFKRYTDKQKAPLYLALFTHINELNQVSAIPPDIPIKDIISPFVDQFEQKIKQEPVKRRAAVLDIQDHVYQNIKADDPTPQHQRLAELYRKIFQSAEQLHQTNHSKIDGIAISTGLIKFNNTEDAYHFSRYLFDTDTIEQQAIVKIECYHARHFPIRRNYTEKTLNSLLNRKKGNAEFKKLSLVKRALQQAKEQQKHHILLLVVSTTLIEIGRDFDFDWGIIEPRSHWSIIQTVGRIMRHRTKPRYDNVILLSHSMKVVRGNKKNKGFYASPGAEIEENNLSLKDEDKGKPVQELFEYSTLKHKIDASITLKNKAGQAIKALENQQIEHFSNNKNLASLQSYLNEPLEYLSTFNTDRNPFRGKYQPHYTYQLNEQNQWQWLDKKTGKAFSADEHFDEIVLKYPHRCLLDKSLEEIEDEYALQKIELGREIISMKPQEKDKKYNEFLGVL